MLDLILIVAAFAIWFAWTRSFPPPQWDNDSIWAFHGGHGITTILKHQGGYFLVLASLTLLVVRLRGPRPPRRRLWRQPGLAASAGAVIGFLIGSLRALAEWSTRLPPEPSMHMPPPEEPFFSRAEAFVGPGVMGAWLALILIGRWRSERGAIDRLGRLVGIGWIVEFFMAEVPTRRGWITLLDALTRWWSR